MIGIEPNILLRLATRDDAAQVKTVFDIEGAAPVEDALGMFASGNAEFPDCLTFARNGRHCDATITFDRAARGLPGCVLL